MRFQAIFDKLVSDDDFICELLLKIPKRNKRTEKSIAESITKLAYICYLLGNESCAKKIVDLVGSVSFENDYDYWTWVEFSLSLKAYLCKSECSDSIKVINDAVNFGEGLPKKIKLNVHNRFMEGVGVVLDCDCNDVSPIDEFDFRLIYFMKLVKLSVLGGKLSNNDLNSEISFNIKRMKELLSTIRLTDIEPFH